MKNICVITGSRADYGLLKKLIKKIDKERNFNLKLLVTGSHLSEEFGNTFSEIKDDGIKISDKVEIVLSSDTPSSVCNSMGLATILFSKSFKLHNPDAVIILGDRYELLSAASSALIHNIPIIHLHGGEKTTGAFDDAIRNAITKMSNLHFVTNNEYKKRIIQMGENKKNVFNVGGFGAEAIKNINMYTKKQIQEKLNFKFYYQNILITFHPETHDINNSKKSINIILNALNNFKEIKFIFTLSNADPEGRIINKQIINYVSKNNNCSYFYSLGQKMYYSVLNNIDCVLGNSSSGILEAPSFKIGTINIGNRQHGRVQAKSVINSNLNIYDIKTAIKKSLTKKFKSSLKNLKSPYYKPNTSENVIKILKKIKKIDTLKEFTDIKF